MKTSIRLLIFLSILLIPITTTNAQGVLLRRAVKSVISFFDDWAARAAARAAEKEAAERAARLAAEKAAAERAAAERAERAAAERAAAERAAAERAAAESAGDPNLFPPKDEKKVTKASKAVALGTASAGALITSNKYIKAEPLINSNSNWTKVNLSTVEDINYYDHSKGSNKPNFYHVIESDYIVNYRDIKEEYIKRFPKDNSIFIHPHVKFLISESSNRYDKNIANEELINKFAEFRSNFKNIYDKNITNAFYVLDSFYSLDQNAFLIIEVVDGRFIGELLPITDITYTPNMGEKSQFLSNELNQWVTANYSKYPFTYYIAEKESEVLRQLKYFSKKYNFMLISRKNEQRLSFNKSLKRLKFLKDRTINSSRLSKLNGIPITDKAQKAQLMNSIDLKKLKSLHGEIESKFAKSTKTIRTKEDLIYELTKGNNDMLLIIAHCDQKNLYFGSSSISFAELAKLKVRKEPRKARAAILLSCFTGKLYPERKSWVTFLRDNVKSFGQLLVDKNFVDLAIAPRDIIDGNEVIKLTEALQTNKIGNLSNAFEPLLGAQQKEILDIFNQGNTKKSFYNIAKR